MHPSCRLLAAAALIGCQDHTAPAGTCASSSEFGIDGCATVSGVVTGFTPLTPNDAVFITAAPPPGHVPRTNTGVSGRIGADGRYSIWLEEWDAPTNQPDTMTVLVQWTAWRDTVNVASDSAKVLLTFVPLGHVVTPATFDIAITPP